jgi:hypothetical protein
MSTKNLSLATLCRFLAIVVGLTVLAGCGGGSSGTTTTTTPTGTPAVTISGSTLSNNTLTFSSAVGVASAAQTLTITDSGTASVTFSSFTASTGFSVSATLCGTGIGAGGACSITVTFTPSASGTTSGSLSIVDNAGTQTVTLTGTASVPSVSVSPPSLNFASQAQGSESPSQQVTLTNTGTVAVSITSIGTGTANFTETNNCPASLSGSANCTINVFFTPTTTGTINGALTISDNASTSPTVGLTGMGTAASTASITYNGSAVTSLSFTGITVGSSSSAEVLTLANTGTSAFSISSIGVTAGSTNFSETNNCPASLGAGLNCTINVTFTPQAGGALTGTLTLIDQFGTQTLSLSGSGLANTVPVQVNFGVNGYTGAPTTSGSSYYNGIFTSVTVCSPGSTTNCATIPNVLVDTGSVGLRVLSSGTVGATAQVSSLNLPQVIDSTSSYPLYECVQYGDLSYTWGPMQMASVTVGGETASALPGAAAGTGIPIQVISAGVNPPQLVYYENEYGYYNPCESLPGSNDEELSGGFNDNSVTTLGANGILGIGNTAQDCGVACASNVYGSYLVCNSVGSTTCSLWTAQVNDQVWNPVSAFPTDNNGVSISLPTVPATGQATATGTLTFGIGTENNNALGSAVIYGQDSDSNFQSATLNGVTYTSNNSGGTFIDSGSNSFYVSDAVTLGTSDCYLNDIVNINNDLGWYCPSSPLDLQLGLAGTNGTNTTVSLPIGNATNLFAANTSFAVFNNLGGPSCIAETNSPCTGVTPSPDYFDLGLPFFFGRPVFVGIESTSTTAPNGYWAF